MWLWWMGDGLIYYIKENADALGLCGEPYAPIWIYLELKNDNIVDFVSALEYVCFLTDNALYTYLHATRQTFMQSQYTPLLEIKD